MTEKLEARLIEALKKVDVFGDIAPEHVHDPMTMILRERALQDDLMRWDDNRGRYELSITGRWRIINPRSRKSANFIRFPQPARTEDEAASK
jgi:hypothetical protein